MGQTAKFISAVAVSLLVAACGSSSSTNSTSSSATATATATVVKSAANATLGSTVLVDSQGLTLYHLSGEQNGKWICTSTACVQAWHPLTVPKGAAVSSSVASLTTIKRPDGAVQVTYKGTPLYTFAGDQRPGQAKGEGVKDVGVWTAVTTSAAASSKPATSTPTPASASGGPRYGY